MSGTVFGHERQLFKDISHGLGQHNIEMTEAEPQECDCFLVVYRVPARIVCEDLTKKYGGIE